jgi:hypothetical protein
LLSIAHDHLGSAARYPRNAELYPDTKEANAIRTSMPASKKHVHIAPQYD